MNYKLLLDVRRVVATVLFCLIVSSPAIAGLADSGNSRSLTGFAVDGVVLGMRIERVLEIFPAAQIERVAANCYRYGQAISVPELTRRVVRHKDDEGNLTMYFEPPGIGGRLTRIHYDRPVDPSEFDIHVLLDGLSMRYGAYDRIFHRRKMEPAGRIVGFEWRSADGAILRVVLRNDYRENGDDMRLSFLARSTAPATRPIRRALLQLCGRP